MADRPAFVSSCLELNRPAIGQALAEQGVDIQTGPLVCRIQSRLKSLQDPIQLLYRHHALRPAQGFADFHIKIKRATGPRGWIKPQVDFMLDEHRPFEPLPAGQAFAMLEWGLNWCVAAHAHQFLVVHAASLARGGRAVVMPGAPGSGKSTLCAALMLKGWRLLSDELTLIDPNTGTLHALARPINLKNDSIELIRQHHPKACFGPILHDTQKGRVSHLAPNAESAFQMHIPAHPAWLVFPRYRAGAGLSVRPEGKAKSFMRLADQCFNYTLQGARGFKALSQLVEEVDCLDLQHDCIDESLAFFDALC
jgi:HprK-related kinase A